MNNKKEIKVSNKFIYKYTINKSENINIDQFESLITDRINWVFKEESIRNRIDFYVISFEEIGDKILYKAYIELGLDIKKELLEKYFMESNFEMGIISSSELIIKKWPIIDELIKKGDFKSNPNLIIDNKGKRLSFKKHVILLLFNQIPLDEINRILRNIYPEEFSFIFKGWGKEKYTVK